MMTEYCCYVYILTLIKYIGPWKYTRNINKIWSDIINLLSCIVKGVMFFFFCFVFKQSGKASKFRKKKNFHFYAVYRIQYRNGLNEFEGGKPLIIPLLDFCYSLTRCSLVWPDIFPFEQK